MHIPDGFINGATSAGFGIAAAGGVGAALRQTGEGSPDMAQSHVFRLSFEALPWYFLVVVALFVVYAYRRRTGPGSPDAA